MNTNHRITDSTPLLGGELVASVVIGSNRVVQVKRGIPQAGPIEGRAVVVLRGMHCTDRGWVYSGREIIVPAEEAPAMAEAILQAAGGTGGSDATDGSPAPGG